MLNIISATTNSSAGGIIMLVLFPLFAVILAFAAVIIIGKYHKVADADSVKVGKLKTADVFLIILFAGLALRILFTFLINGYGYDYTLAYGIANSFKTNGDFEGFSKTYLGVGPLFAYIAALFGNLGMALSLSKDAIWMQFFLKLPYILADIAAAIILYFAARKYSNRYVALAVSALVFLNPLFITMSSVWGSPVSLYCLVLLLMVLFVLNKNIFGMVCTAVAGLLLNNIFMFVAIIVLAYLVYLFVQAIIKIVRLHASMDEISKDNTLSNVYYVPICLALGLMAVYLIALPAFYADGVIGFGKVYKALFITPLEFNSAEYAYTYFSMNALGIFTIFIQNFVEIGNKFPAIVYTAVILAISLAVMLATFLSKKNRANLVVIIAYVFATVGTYFIGCNEWTIAPAVIALIFAFITVKDKRLLHIAVIYSLILTANGLLVLMGGGQIGTALVDGYFSLATDDLLNVFSILFAVISVIMHIYFTVIALDIALTKNRHLFATGISSGLAECAKEWYLK